MADCDSRLNSMHGVAISVDDILATTGKALAIDPNLAEAHAARGYALMIGSRRAEAASAFEQALALDPNCYEANQLYAQFCVTKGDFEPAAKHLPARDGNPARRLSVAAFPSAGLSVAGAPRGRGMKYARLGVKRAEEALRLHPESSKPAQQGACALAFLGERDRAKEWLARALAIDPDDNLVRYNAACTYSLLGESRPIHRSFGDLACSRWEAT